LLYDKQICQWCGCRVSVGFVTEVVYVQFLYDFHILFFVSGV
jgi:hypothetical protein